MFYFRISETAYLAMEEQPISPTTDTDLALKRFLNKPIRLELSDGRIVIGKLVCTDNTPNIIVQGAQEYWLKDWPNGYIRELCVVVIGGKNIKSIKVLKDQS